MSYTEIDKVRYFNRQSFIDDFKSAKTILVYPERTQDTFKITKGELWEAAKRGEIHYTMDLCPFIVKRKCLTVL
jgi:hypothetical protein